MTTQPPIEAIKKLYKRYQNPGMALPEPTEYETGFDQALDLALGILYASTRDSENVKNSPVSNNNYTPRK